MLGQDWQNIAHVTTDETKEFIAMAAQMSEDELKGKMKLAEAVKGQLGLSLSKARVSLRSKDGKVGIYISGNG